MKLEPREIAPFVVALLSEAGSHVTAQPRPTRGAHAGEGLTPETVAARAFPTFANDFYPRRRSAEISEWGPD
jgi:hypothetical protein